MYDYDQIKELIALVAESGLGEFEIERNGFRLRIAGQQQAAVSAVVAAPTATMVPAAPAVSPTSASDVAPAADAGVDSSAPSVEEPAPAPSGHILSSPIVGTFYVAPSPDADPFVRVGDQVRRGQVVCIVEAMKLMNEIEADIDGEIVEVHVENAEAVEYGQALFSIRPA